MKRYAENNLINWYQKNDRRPLILRGARQVGKSTLVRNFAKNLGLDLLEINLEKVRFKSIHQDHFELDNWINEIEFLSKKKIGTTSLIFLDEIQRDPVALERLRYFYEERPHLAVISAGSLLELILHQAEISFPVGRVSFYHLGPMSFTEYLLSQNRDDIAEQILTNKLPSFSHEPLLQELKKYFFIGGMPKAVLSYKETNSMMNVREVHRDIAQSYINDFPKYGKRINLDRIERIFNAAPLMIGKKVIFQHIDRESRSLEIKRALELLQLANILTFSYHTDASTVPIKAQMDHSIFKFYFLDIGLLNYFHQLDWPQLETLFDDNFVTKGILAEQYVAQHLAYIQGAHEPPELFYWLRDKSIQKAELDFLISKQSTIVPIEVKSQKGGSLKSLQVFAREKQIYDALKFSKSWFGKEIIQLGNQKQLQVQNIPLYAIEGI